MVCALFNIVLHLQSPLIFFQEKLKHDKDESDPDPGSVILMCVEVLTKVAGRHALFEMDSTHVGHSLHMPSTLFKHFSQLRALPITSHSVAFTARGVRLVDREFSVDLFAACCKLLYTVLRHRKRYCALLFFLSVSNFFICLSFFLFGSQNQCYVFCRKIGIYVFFFLKSLLMECMHFVMCVRFTGFP